MDFTEEQKEKALSSIFERIGKGQALRNILRENEMPDNTKFYKWIDGDKMLLERYLGARAQRADGIFEDLFDIADDQENDVYEDKDGKEQTNHNVINRARIRIDTRKWILARMDSKKYGDKIQQEVSGDLKQDLSNESLDKLKEMQREAVKEALKQNPDILKG